MNFKLWLEREESMGVIRNPWQAMELLGLTNQAGELIPEEGLMRAYRKVALAAHPDVKKDDGQKMKFINAAKDLLLPVVRSRSPLPMPPQAPPVQKIHSGPDFSSTVWDDLLKQNASTQSYKFRKKNWKSWLGKKIKPLFST